MGELLMVVYGFPKVIHLWCYAKILSLQRAFFWTKIISLKLVVLFVGV